MEFTSWHEQGMHTCCWHLGGAICFLHGQDGIGHSGLIDGLGEGRFQKSRPRSGYRHVLVVCKRFGYTSVHTAIFPTHRDTNCIGADLGIHKGEPARVLTLSLRNSLHYPRAMM